MVYKISSLNPQDMPMKPIIILILHTNEKAEIQRN